MKKYCLWVRLSAYSIILLGLFSTSLSAEIYDANSWGKAYLIMVDNKTQFDVELDFPDDASSHRVIKPGQQIGKMPLSDFAKDTSTTLSLTSPVGALVDASDGSIGSSAWGNVASGNNPYASETDTGSSSSVAFKVMGDMSAQLVRNMVPIVTDRNSIKSNSAPTIHNTNISRKPSLKGKGLTVLQNYSEDQSLVLQPMKGVGGIWLAESDFDIPSSVIFKVFIQDKGSMAFVFGENEILGARIKIVFGADDNTKISVLVDDKVVAFSNEIDVDLVKLDEGRFKDFWISFISDDILLVGVGLLSEQKIVLQTKIPSLSSLCKKVGVTSFDYPVSISSIKILSPLKIVSSFDKTSVKQSSLKQPIMLPSLGVGRLELRSVLDLQTCKISCLGNDQHFATIVTDLSKMLATIDIYSSDETSNILFSDTFSLVSNQDFPVLLLSFDTNFLLVCQAKNDLSDIRLCRIVNHKSWGLIESCKIAEFSGDFVEVKAFVGSPLKFEMNMNASASGKRTLFAGNLRVIRPFEYDFDQQGPAIICNDRITKESIILGQAPQQEAYYSFKATINSVGLIDFSWVLDPINPKKMGLKALVGAVQAAAAQVFTAADQMQQDVVGDPTLSAEIKLTNDTALTAFAGTAMMALAGVGSSSIAYGFRDEGKGLSKAEKADDTPGYYVDKETMHQVDPEKNIPVQAKVNKSLLETKLQQVISVNISSREKFDLVLGTCRSIIDLIDHPYVLTQSSQMAIMKLVDTLVAFKETFVNQTTVQDAYKQDQKLASDSLNISLLKLLISISENDVLMDIDNSYSNVFVSKIAGHLQIICSDYLANAFNKTILLPKSRNAVYWSKQEISDKGGAVLFSARGSGDLNVLMMRHDAFQLLKNRFLVKNDILYEVGVARNNNHEFCISTVYRGIPIKKVAITNEDLAAMSALDSKSYWIDWSDGNFSMGSGSLGSNPILNWTDADIQKTSYVVGLQSTVSDISISDFAIGPSIKNLSKGFLRFLSTCDSTSIEDADSFLLTPNQPRLLDEKFIDGQGLFASKVALEVGAVLCIVFSNDQFKINYKVKIERSEKELIVSLYSVRSAEQLIKTERIANEKTNIPIWLELDKKVLSIACQPLWEAKTDFCVMVPDIYLCDLALTLISENKLVKIQKPAFMDIRKNLNFNYLRMLSGGKFKVPSSLQNDEAAKKKAVESSIRQIMDSLKKENSLLETLDKEEMDQYFDLLYYAYQTDSFDQLEADSLSTEAFLQESTDSFESSDPLARDDMKKDILRTDDGPSKIKDDAPEHVMTGKKYKMQAMGIQGIQMQLTGESRQIKDFFTEDKDVEGNVIIDEKTGKAKKVGFGLARDVRNLKRELSQGVGAIKNVKDALKDTVKKVQSKLAAKKTATKMSDAQQGNFLKALAEFPGKVAKILKGGRDRTNEKKTPKPTLKERLKSVKDGVKDGLKKVKDSIKGKAKAIATKENAAVSAKVGAGVAFGGIASMMPSDDSNPALVIAPDIEDDSANAISTNDSKKLSVEQASDMVQK